MAVIAIVILIGTGAYAYYQTNINGTTSGTIAKWSFKANNQTESFNIDLGKMYPGKSGVYNIELSAEDSDLDVYYELFLVVSYPTYRYLSWKDEYEKEFSIGCEGYFGRYGIIPAGEKTILSIYYDWPYEHFDGEYNEENPLINDNLSIIARQYAGNNTAIPINLLNNSNIKFFEEINSTSGYITAYIMC